MTNNQSSLTDLIFNRSTVKRALMVASIVGPVLTLINQWDAFFGEDSLNWIKAVLSCAVPYCVATYAAVSQNTSAKDQESKN